MLTLDRATMARLEARGDAELGRRLTEFLASRAEVAAAQPPDLGGFVGRSVALARNVGLQREQDIARFAWLALLLRAPGAPPVDPCDRAGLPCTPEALRAVEHAIVQRLRAPER